MWNKYNRWFWIATTLEGESWDFGRLGSIVVARYLPRVRLVISIQILMFYMYLGFYHGTHKPVYFQVKYWGNWWKLWKGSK